MKTKQDSTTLELVIAAIIGIPISIVVSFYQIFIIIKLVDWFQLPIHLSYLQWFGAGVVLRLIGPDSPKSETESLSGTFGFIFERIITLTVLLGLCFIIKSILV